MTIQPTVFHITHQKAGSQWVAEVLKYSAGERVVLQQPRAAHVCTRPLKPGGVYLSVYLPRQRLETVLGLSWSHWREYGAIIHYPKVCLLNWWRLHIQRRPYRHLIVLRDLRDTLVSMYFSFKISHPLISVVPQIRQVLNGLNQKEGFRYLMNLMLPQIADIQGSWMHSGGLLIKYEQLVADEHAVFERIIEYCQIDVDRQRLHEIIHYNSFEMVTGRRPGQEDLTAHQRKGIVGDWQNYFSDRVQEEFKQHFEAHAPPSYYSLTLTFEDEQENIVHNQVDATQSDQRELGIRVVSILYT